MVNGKSAITALLFDFDGTLADSESNYYEADRLFLLRRGITFTKSMKEKYIGMGTHRMMEEIKDLYHLEGSIEELITEKNELYLALARHATPLFGEMRLFLERVRSNGYKTAIASGTPRSVLEELVNRTGIAGLFDCIVSTDEVPRGKPEPDVFLLAAKRLGVMPMQAVVIEDALYGVIAAKKALMKCIAVPSVLTESTAQAFLDCELLFSGGMNEFCADKAFDWLSHV